MEAGISITGNTSVAEAASFLHGRHKALRGSMFWDRTSPVLPCTKSPQHSLGGHMAFIRVQKLRTDREGKIVWLADDKKSGIFLSTIRGLVLYDARSNTFSEVEKDDPRIRNMGIDEWTCEAGVYKVFGDDWLLAFLIQTGMSRVIARTFRTRRTGCTSISCTLSSLTAAT